MDEIVDVRNAGYVCRLCLSTKEPKSSVFADQAFASVSLVTKIQTCLSIEISTSDKISTLICSDCLRRVNKWHNYKEYCLRSQQKLQQCLGDKSDNPPQVGNIKVEPVDFCEPVSPSSETVPLSSDEDNAAEGIDDSAEPVVSVILVDDEDAGTAATSRATAIKRERGESEESNAVPELESVCSTELLLNPMAVTGHNKEDRLMEADSTQKPTSVRPNKGGTKKKVRRGPKTHYRGLRRFKQRCSHCQIYLHSKESYGKHMDRFHSGKIYVRKQRGPKAKVSYEIVENESEKLNKNGDKEMDIVDVETVETLETVEDVEMVEDVEDELISLEKDAPLTPVQQNIISQLKTFSCYSCRQCFNDRRSTLNHIRQHMPDLRPYTCIACLTEFADRSIYKLHCGASFQCAMKIALVVPQHGTEKYFTCNMCLRSLANRRELLSHLSRHSDKQYEQLIARPFQSPPRLKPVVIGTAGPPLSASSASSSSLKSEQRRNNSETRGINVVASASNRNDRVPAPYKNGDPAHNHMCVHCGMIYRYKQNLFKHLSLCKKLPTNARICYRCVNCGMTFLAFNKFQTHLINEHRKRDFVCYRCNARREEPSDFLSHYREHCLEEMRYTVVSPRVSEVERSIKTVGRWNSDFQDSNDEPNTDEIGPPSSNEYSCALCPKSSYPTRSHLTEHRKVYHPKLSNVYSCAICRCTFGKSSTLEAHMADHEIGILPTNARDPNATVPTIDEPAENVAGTKNNRFSIKSDPGGSNTECHTCGKVFANYPNLRRHIRTVHDTVGRFSCFTCAKTFVREEQWTEHVEKEHRRVERSVNCPQCPEIFVSQQELVVHRQGIHGVNGEDHLACYICGKSFANESSLKIHRGHHFRVNSRLSIGNNRREIRQGEEHPGTLSMEQDELENERNVPDLRPIVKSPRARKSFPNGNPATGGQSSRSFLQCQVCDDRFGDVAELRKHLWDVHCARNKPEKNFASDKLQCELCTNVLPDEESLASHIKWHESNPILNNGQSFETPAQCDLCGKFYSSAGNLRKHKKRHKSGSLVVNKLQSALRKKSTIGDGFSCDVCRKIFAVKSTMIKHKAVAHPRQTHGQAASSGTSGGVGETIVKPEVIKPVRPRLDFDEIARGAQSFTSGDVKKSITCNLCRKIVPDARALYKHRQLVHKITNDRAADSRFDFDLSGTSPAVGTQVSCTACKKLFSNVANMRQHYTKVHCDRSSQFRCSVDGCKLAFKTLIAKQNHEKIHTNVMYTCALCPRHMLTPAAMAEHMLNAHKTNYPSGHNKITLCKKIDLDNYVVKGANGRQCPVCKITYPNNKALKVHYLKVHEGAA